MVYLNECGIVCALGDSHRQIAARLFDEARSGLTVTDAWSPGLIETDMISDAPLDEILKLIPARRVGQPDEVAAAVSFLIGVDAAYITRQVLSVNGGLA